MRKFKTGATRADDTLKINPEAALSPLALRRYCEYILANRKTADGELRPDDNWQKGIPRKSYMESLFRHFLDAWEISRGYKHGDIEDALCGAWFNLQGYLHESVKGNRVFGSITFYKDKLPPGTIYPIEDDNVLK